MSYHSPQRIGELTIETGMRKARLPFYSLLILGFLAGAFIAFGFLLYIRVTAYLPKEWGTLVGAAVFPVGIILVVLAGGELVTGNMMSVAIAYLAKKITWKALLVNWFWVTVSNFIGAVFVAYFFGHVVGLTESGAFLAKTVAVAQAKLNDTFLQALLSAIGCNWLVCLGVWIAMGAESFTGKILGMWFPIMTFVAIGFQHTVANMFVIPAAIFAGHFLWSDFFNNFIPVFLGNIIGGAIFVGFAYFLAYNRAANISNKEAGDMKQLNKSA